MVREQVFGRSKIIIGLSLAIILSFYLGTLYQKTAVYKQKSDGKVVRVKSFEYGIDRLVFEKGMMVNGKKEGRWIKYNDEGFILSEGFYVNGLKNGTFITYNSIDSTIHSINQYRKDKLSGISILFYSNNMINSFDNFRENSSIGKSVIYFKNGFVKEFTESSKDTISYIYFSPGQDTVKVRKYKGDSLIYKYDKM